MLRAAVLGAVLGAIAGAVTGLVLYGDRLLVPLYALLLGAMAGTVLLAGASLARDARRRRLAPGDGDVVPAEV